MEGCSRSMVSVVAVVCGNFVTTIEYLNSNTKHHAKKYLLLGLQKSETL